MTNNRFSKCYSNGSLFSRYTFYHKYYISEACQISKSWNTHDSPDHSCIDMRQQGKIRDMEFAWYLTLFLKIVFAVANTGAWYIYKYDIKRFDSLLINQNHRRKHDHMMVNLSPRDYWKTLEWNISKRLLTKKRNKKTCVPSYIIHNVHRNSYIVRARCQPCGYWDFLL